MGKTFIIAEMSANHNGSKQIGIETIRAAKRAGADAIKLQTYTADTITLDNDKMEFMADSTSVWAGMRLYDLYKQAYTPWEQHSLSYISDASPIPCDGDVYRHCH